MKKFSKNRLVPKLLSILTSGYKLKTLRLDALAGLTVAVISIPLAMALGIACGASPEQGLITAVLAGFLISLFGGSRTQIGGPTGAFVVIVYKIIVEQGYESLLIVTLMAGIILILAGYVKLGQLIKFIPISVVTGFTTGIAVIIASTQIKEFLGLHLNTMPAEFIPQWKIYFTAFNTIHLTTFSIGLISLLTIILLKKFRPRWPRYLIVLIISSFFVTLLNIPIETIGSQFPNIKSGIAAPHLPAFTFNQIITLLPSALTIAFLAGIESLLSAVVADGMTGFRHRSNQELIGQGIANIGSAFFGGLPAAGAIARTATNITAGGKTPISGIFNAVFILLFIFFGMDFLKFVPMTALSAIIFMVAWEMSEVNNFIRMFQFSNRIRIVLSTTFLLTIFVNLTLAIGVGVILASLLFMEQMSKSIEISNSPKEFEKNNKEPNKDSQLPSEIKVFWIAGPIFFGMAEKLSDIFIHTGQAPKVLIIRMRLVPYLDETGASTLINLIKKCHINETTVIFSSIQKQPAKILSKIQKQTKLINSKYTSTYREALIIANKILNTTEKIK
jgi:sulfate permease, SulP family